MKSETKILYNKYSYFLFVLSNDKNYFFTKDNTTLDFDDFFEYFNDVVNWHCKIKPLYRNFHKRRSQIIKNFEHTKYLIMLRPKFCYDVRNLIVTFILKKI